MSTATPRKDGYEGELVGDEAVAKVRSLLDHFRTAMLTTVTADGTVHTRPMGFLRDAAETFDGRLWFFADDRSQKVREIVSGAPSSLIFQNDGDSVYLKLDGDAAIIDDRGQMEALYTPLLRTWFPDGLEDPHVTLIRFDASGGQYWASPGGLLQVLGAFTKATLAGKPGAGGHRGDLSL